MADQVVTKVGILAPMPPELKAVRRALPLRRTRVGDLDAYVGRTGRVEVIATLTGIGTALAAKAAERLLATGVQHVIVSGIAGGVDPKLAIGDLVVPEVVLDRASGTTYRPHPLGGVAPAGTIVTTDELLDYATLGPMVADGIVAVDMETAVIAATCERHGTPWTAFRGISDRVVDGEINHAVLGLVKADGSPNVGALLRYLGANPTRVRFLARLARDMRVSANAAARAAARACAEL